MIIEENYKTFVKSAIESLYFAYKIEIDGLDSSEYSYCFT